MTTEPIISQDKSASAPTWIPKVESISKVVDLATKMLVILGAIVFTLCLTALPGHVAMAGFDFASLAVVVAVTTVLVTVELVAGFGVSGLSYRAVVGSLDRKPVIDRPNIWQSFILVLPEFILYLGLAIGSVRLLFVLHESQAKSIGWEWAFAAAIPAGFSMLLQLYYCRALRFWDSWKNFWLAFAILFATSFATLVWTIPLLFTTLLAWANVGVQTGSWVIRVACWMVVVALLNVGTATSEVKRSVSALMCFIIGIAAFDGVTVLKMSLRSLGLLDVNTTLTIKQTWKSDFDNAIKMCRAITPGRTYPFNYKVSILNGLGKNYVLTCRENTAPISVPKDEFTGERGG